MNHDIVVVPCPKCGLRQEFISISGPCKGVSYQLHDAPDDVLVGVNKQAPYACTLCKIRFMVKFYNDGDVRPVEWVEIEGWP
jgi:hypothetical protein